MSAPRIAIAGCGAVVEAYYGPVLRARIEAGRVQVAALHDPSPARMAAVASKLFPQAARFARFEELLASGPDLLIVASPPSAHAEQAIQALDRGMPVLCEKPLAPSASEAEAMAEASQRAGRLLAVGMVRRQFPASRIVRRMIAQGGLGSFLGAEGFEGGPFRWPVASPAYFRRTVSGGGVLADIGAHVLDLLHHWLGPLELIGAEDDAMGGVEANARLELRAGGAPVRLRLSRDWVRPNRLLLRFERGVLVWENDAPERVSMTLPDGSAVALTEPGAPADFLACFGAQLDAVLAAVAGKEAEVAKASDVVATVRLIQQAYDERRPMAMEWLEAPDVA